MLELEHLLPNHYDLITPDGIITSLQRISDAEALATVFIENISSAFVGFRIPADRVFFNIKSTLAQIGLDGVGSAYHFDIAHHCAEVQVALRGYGELGRLLLSYLDVGAYIGKLFAADERRRVRHPSYLSRMFGRADRWGKPLLSLGGLHGSEDLILDIVENRTVAYLTLQQGKLTYEGAMKGFLPTLAKALHKQLPMRDTLRLHQLWQAMVPRNIHEDEILLVRTLPLHIRTVFARVVVELLSSGYKHTSASILQPDTSASGDIYELFGQSQRELTDIPLEFYTLEPYREYVFFSDRDQLLSCLEDSEALFTAFSTAPQPLEEHTSVFVVKGEQLKKLAEKDWIKRTPLKHDLPGLAQGPRQALMVERYIEQQPSYPFLKAIDDGKITSQGVLFSRYFPSPFMKRMLLSNQVQRCLKGIYFQYPSLSSGDFFSAEDRALLHDLYQFAVPVFWVDESTRSILKYVQKPERDSGLFVPLHAIDIFFKATLFGIYGSNLLTGNFEQQLQILLEGILTMRAEMAHPLLNAKTAIALVTGGGPGVMEVGNRIAKELAILSCANIVDFTRKEQLINEQRQNPFVEAKMTYRLDKLVERQAEFNLDFPIFLMGGMGTDFELTLEEVRRKVGAVTATPMILFGEQHYWKQKISSRFRCNRENGTIAGSEWLSNTLYCIQTAEQGLRVYRQYFEGTLPIGPKGPIYDEGFAIVK